MIKTFWRSVMDSDQNALNGLPKPVKLQLMVTLALVWSAIFCAGTGMLIWLPGYIFAHVALLLIGLFGTSLIFKLAANRARPVDVARTATGGNPDQAEFRD